MDSTLAHHLQREQGHLQGLGLHGLVLFSGDQVEQKVQVHWNYTIISDFINKSFSFGHMKPKTPWSKFKVSKGTTFDNKLFTLNRNSREQLTRPGLPKSSSLLGA